MNNTLLINSISIVIATILLGLLEYIKRIPQAKQIVLAVVIQAENIFGSDTGTMKYAYVSGLIYTKLPSVIRFAVSQQTVDKWIEEAVGTLKTKLQEPTIEPNIVIQENSEPIIETDNPIDTSTKDSIQN